MTCGECANVTAPGSGFPNHVYCRRFLLHMEKREDASRCRDFIPKPQTNADRIRQMSDEELAIALYAGCSGRECPEGMWDNPLTEDEEDSLCLKCTIAWLKATVEEVQE